MNCHCMHTPVKPQSLAEHVADYEKNKQPVNYAASLEPWILKKKEAFESNVVYSEPHLAIQLRRLIHDVADVSWRAGVDNEAFGNDDLEKYVEQLETLIAKQVQGPELSLLKHIEYLSNGIEKLLEERE